ncbi:hypothetical protein [Devosia elaeis]|uniref:Uncharacterized protein n=1 Tax=Devosia elaeis TaxID=1770058 RepID=A0A178HJK5_9HYPH|nr:hypothetical protein [Devosia elaeis]OAM73053.1 hypothetical protein A3840_18720 [Devosia elaeis]
MTLTWEIVAAFLVAGGAVAGGFWRIYALIETAKKDAVTRAEAAIALVGVTRDELAAHKLHVAETYTTKAGLAEQTAQIMKAIDGVSGKIDHLNGRIDGLMKPTASRARSQ